MTGSEDHFQKAMNQGHSAAWDQNWQQAAEFYRAAMAESGDHPQPLINLGLALIELEQFPDALRCYQRAAQLAPEDPLPLEKIGQLCEWMGNPNIALRAYLRAADLYISCKDAYKAIENFEHAIRLDPGNLAANTRLGMIYERLGNDQKAVKAYLASASAFQSAGKPESARQMIEQALKIMPTSQEALQFKSLLDDYKPLPRESLPIGAPASQPAERAPQKPKDEILEQALDPIQEAVKHSLAMLAGLVLETEESKTAPSTRRGLQALVTGASEMFDKSQDWTTVKLQLSQVVDLQGRGEKSQSAEELQKAVDSGLDHPAAFYDLGYLYSEVGNALGAIQNLQHALKDADFALGARLLLGELLLQTGHKLEAAIEYLQALKLADIQISPMDQAAGLQRWYELLIETQIKRSGPELQARLCENIPVMLLRADWRLSLLQIRSQLPGYRPDGPLTPLGEVLTQVSSSQVIDCMTTIYESSKRGLFSSAMEEAFYALQLAPTYLPMHALIGDLLEKTGDNERALAKYQVVSRTYAARGEMPQSVEFARKVVALSPGDLEARRKFIEMLIIAGQTEEAIEEYSQLAEFYYAIADLDSAHKVYMEAFNTAQRVGLDQVLKVKILEQAADIDLQRMEWRQAIRIFEQIRTFQPDDPTARSQIIRLNLRLGQEPQALAELDQYASYLTSSKRESGLVAFMEGLLIDYPDNIPIRRRLANVYQSAGQVDEAVKQLDLIGETHLQRGDTTGAIQTIETIISMNPPDQVEYQTLLEQLRSQIH